MIVCGAGVFSVAVKALVIVCGAGVLSNVGHFSSSSP